MTTTTEGIGTSVWLPVKDYWGDEPDNGVTFTVISPKDLTGVSNGRLIEQRTENGKNVSVWEVKNPINDYSITPYVGNYVHFGDSFDGEKGKLSLDYYVIKENLDKAKKQFEQVKPMLKAFEHWFGPYPFYEDGYKLVETPHLGMEHQSAVAYGNKYQNGYLGRDLSGTGVGLKFDFIIIHESGHEWFANNITAQDTADMWVHESFTCYSETLYSDFIFGKEDGNKYLSVRDTTSRTMNQLFRLTA
jgi:aminopeptidase N